MNRYRSLRPQTAACGLLLLALGFFALSLPSEIGGARQANGAVLKHKATDKPAHPLAANIECVSCHKETIDGVWKNPHARIALTGMKEGKDGFCESCHKKTDGHKDDNYDRSIPFRYTPTSPHTSDEKNKNCLTCHKQNAHLKSWNVGTHANSQVACVDCHKVHQVSGPGSKLLKTDEVKVCGSCHQNVMNDLKLPHHMPVGKGGMACSDCHNPHGSPNPSMLVGASVNQTCTNCHQEKRGPFLHAHPPVDESCLNCHTPHGSANAGMVTVKAPMLCLQCHTPPTTSHGSFNLPGPDGKIDPSVNGFNVGSNKSCLNCHSQIHGSNHPGGFRFQR